MKFVNVLNTTTNINDIARTVDTAVVDLLCLNT